MSYFSYSSINICVVGNVSVDSLTQSTQLNRSQPYIGFLKRFISSKAFFQVSLSVA